jgi:hypothetical protein
VGEEGKNLSEACGTTVKKQLQKVLNVVVTGTLPYKVAEKPGAKGADSHVTACPGC